MPSFRCSFLAAAPVADFELLLQGVGHFPQGAELAAALGQALAQLLHGAGVAVLAFDQKRLQIDLRFAHRASLRDSDCWYQFVYAGGANNNPPSPGFAGEGPG